MRLELRQKLRGFPSRTRKRRKHQTKPNQPTDRKREQNKRLLCVKSLRGIWGIHVSFSYCFESSNRFYEPSGQSPFLNMQYLPFGQGRSYVVAVLVVLFHGTFAVMSSHIPLRRPERFWIDILHIAITSSSMPNEIRTFWTPIFWHRKTICTSRPNKRDAHFRI